MPVVSGVLGYALWLCYLTRSIPSDFAEGKWIAISMVCIFQVFLLAVPVLIIVEDDATATFFVISGVLFLISASVCLLMFVPKMKRLLETGEDAREQLRVQFNDAVISKTSQRSVPEPPIDPYRKKFNKSTRNTPSSTGDGWGRMNLTTVNSTNEEKSPTDSPKTHTVKEDKPRSNEYNAELVERLRRNRFNRREAYGLSDLKDEDGSAQP